MTAHNPNVIRTDPDNGILLEHGGKRFLTGGRAEVWIAVDGVEQWREARWESAVVSTLCDRRGMHEDCAPALRPIPRQGERLLETEDGRMWIATAGGSA